MVHNISLIANIVKLTSYLLIEAPSLGARASLPAFTHIAVRMTALREEFTAAHTSLHTLHPRLV